MPQFEVFTHQVQPQQIVKSGFSWPAFFFTWFWALLKRIWWLSALTVIVFFVLAIGIANNPTNNYLRLVISVATMILFGIMGNRWWKTQLVRSGYQFSQLVDGADREADVAQLEQERTGGSSQAQEGRAK